MSEDVTLSAGQVCQLARIKYRQLDHWLRRGYLTIEDVHPGSGAQRRWTAAEAQRVRGFASLVHAGLMPHAAAEAELTIGEHALVAQLGVLYIVGPLP